MLAEKYFFFFICLLLAATDNSDLFLDFFLSFRACDTLLPGSSVE